MKSVGSGFGKTASLNHWAVVGLVRLFWLVKKLWATLAWPSQSVEKNGQTWQTGLTNETEQVHQLSHKSSYIKV